MPTFPRNYSKRRSVADIIFKYSPSVADVVSDGRASKRMNMIGIDANSVIGRQNVLDDDRIIGDYGTSVRNARGYNFAAFLHGSRLAAASTILPKQRDLMWTHERSIGYFL